MSEVSLKSMLRDYYFNHNWKRQLSGYMSMSQEELQNSFKQWVTLSGLYYDFGWFSTTREGVWADINEFDKLFIDLGL